MPPSYWKTVRLALGALVDELDAQALGEEGRLAQALGEHAVVELDLFEDLGVGHERDGGAGRPSLASFSSFSSGVTGLAALEALVPVVAVDVDLELEPLATAR